MSKLTLSVDERVIARAKRYAKQSGVSISQLVESYLNGVAGSPSPTPLGAPILRSVRGSLKKGDMNTYRKHLAAKYK